MAHEVFSTRSASASTSMSLPEQCVYHSRRQNARRYSTWEFRPVDGRRIEAFQNCGFGSSVIKDYSKSPSTASTATTVDVPKTAVVFSFILIMAKRNTFRYLLRLQCGFISRRSA
jgi:hypothetical protein